MSWTNRVRPEVSQVRYAAQDLAQQAGHLPGRAGSTLRMIADCCMIGSVIVGGALASVHLWRAVFPKQKPREGETQSQPQHGSGKGRPPLRIAAARSAYEDDGQRSR